VNSALSANSEAPTTRVLGSSVKSWRDGSNSSELCGPSVRPTSTKMESLQLWIDHSRSSSRSKPCERSGGLPSVNGKGAATAYRSCGCLWCNAVSSRVTVCKSYCLPSRSDNQAPCG
jgi:hypothetical protein